MIRSWADSLLFAVPVAKRFNRHQYAAFEDEPSHQLARTEVIDVFSDDHFLNQVVAGEIFGRPAAVALPDRYIDIAQRRVDEAMSEMIQTRMAL